MECTNWPLGLDVADDTPVGIVAVNYNTRDLIAQLIYSLYRRVRCPRFELVVVDNCSTDGSRELLGELAEAGLCTSLFNREQRYHGPGLNEGIDHLARHQATLAKRDRLRYIWVLDSDCVVMEENALAGAVEVMRQTGAGLVGQRFFDEWQQRDVLALHCLLLDPSLVWQSGVTRLEEEGSPSEALQHSAASAGIVSAEYPFTRNGSIIHVGRGTLRMVARSGDRSNRYAAWARDHQEPHFNLEESTPDRYQRFLEEFRTDVGDVSGQSLIRGCDRFS
jgi:glycosyltransferase involved in cell wall biosynthesis